MAYYQSVSIIPARGKQTIYLTFTHSQ